MPAKPKRRVKGGAYGSRGVSMETTPRPRSVVGRSGPTGPGTTERPPLLPLMLSRFETKSRFMIGATFAIGLLGLLSSLASIVFFATTGPTEAATYLTLFSYVLTLLLGIAFMAVSVWNFRRLSEPHR